MFKEEIGLQYCRVGRSLDTALTRLYSIHVPNLWAAPPLSPFRGKKIVNYYSNRGKGVELVSLTSNLKLENGS